MPIYMDLHTLPGVTALDVAEAHRKDLLHQEEYGCKCMTYWLDEARENVFCLIEGPNKEAVSHLHSRAHGFMPSKIIEVKSELVESFLGRIYDPAKVETRDDGLKLFTDPSFRILLITKITDPVLLQYNLGAEKANELLSRHNVIVRKNLVQFGGREVEHRGTGFISSFDLASKAVFCAIAIQKDIREAGADSTGLRIAINAGEPVAESDKLFGDSIKLAEHMCAVAKDFQVALASTVKDLVSKDQFQNSHHDIISFAPPDEALLGLLFSKLGQNWQNPDFNVTDFCQAMAMSKSQLYRKTLELSGLSPNLLLKEFRLEKARELMKMQRYNISQITFDSGFASPSYFTKCFKKKYGLLPMTYLDMLH